MSVFGDASVDGATASVAIKGTGRGSIVGQEPDWGALPPDAPGLAVSLLHRCLRKDPGRVGMVALQSAGAGNEILHRHRSGALAGDGEAW